MHDLKDHPVINKMQRDGYLVKPRTVKYDALGNEMYKGDPVLKLNGKVFAEEQIELETQLALSECGAIESEA